MFCNTLNGQPIRFQDPTVTLDDGHHLHAVLFLEKLCRVKTYVAQPLDNEPLAFQPAVEPDGRNVVWVPEQLAERELDSPPRRLDTSSDPTLSQRLPGDARYCIELFGFVSRQSQLNSALAFCGMAVGNDGKVRRTRKAVDLDDALARADRLHAALKSRRVHEDVP